MSPIATSQTPTTAEIVRAALGELLYTQKDVARLLGVSARTVQRHPRLWGFQGPDDLAKLVRALWPRNAALARQLAEQVGLDLAAMGLAPKPAPPPPAPVAAPASPKPAEAKPEHAAAVLCAAADAMNVAPREAKPLITAIFKAVAAMDVDHHGLAKLLAQGEATTAPAQSKR